MDVITVAQPAARPWDGHRIVRFLTGLAMLALAVTLRLPGPAVTVPAAPVAPAPAVVAAAAPAEVAATDPAGHEAGRTEPWPAAETVPATAPTRGAVSFTTRVLRGETPGHAGPRAPPAR